MKKKLANSLSLFRQTVACTPGRMHSVLVQLGEKDTSHHGENVQRYFENGEWKTNLEPFSDDGKTSGDKRRHLVV